MFYLLQTDEVLLRKPFNSLHFQVSISFLFGDNIFTLQTT